MIRYVDETGSTNTDLAQAARSAHPPIEGDWLIARRQTAGKGRQGRQWFDGSGNFMGSSVVELRADDPPPASLGFAASLAVAECLEECAGGAADVRTKWPNDVLVNGGKVSGLLMEMVGSLVIIGIGVNLAKAPRIADRKTAALADFGEAPPLEDFADRLAASLRSWINSWRTGGLDRVLAEFVRLAQYKEGASLSVHDSDGSRIEGTFAGLEQSDGALRLRLADGSERVIRAGDIV